MINFGGYYYIQESDIMAIESQKDDSNHAYPFVLTVRTRNEHRYSVRYQTKTARDRVAAEIAEKVEYATRDRDMEQIFNKLYLMQSDLSKLDKRQLRIWRQLKELLGLKTDDGAPCSAS